VVNYDELCQFIYRVLALIKSTTVHAVQDTIDITTVLHDMSDIDKIQLIQLCSHDTSDMTGYI